MAAPPRPRQGRRRGRGGASQAYFISLAAAAVAWIVVCGCHHAFLGPSPRRPLNSAAFAGGGGGLSRSRRGAGPSLHRRAGDSDFSLWAPDNRVVRAVEDLGGRVTKADVLQRGVEAKGLERELLQLARASGAALRVNDKGELLYEFPNDLSGALASSNAAAKAQQVWTTVSPWLSYAGRVLFGASLLATCAILYSAVVVLVSASVSEREDSRGNRSTMVSENSFSMWFGNDLFFWLTPRPYGYYSYYGYGGIMYGDLWGAPPPPPKMSFFESVFSFVFGDGDPNKQLLEEARWQLVGEAITEKGGSVVAEQIAPYLDPPSSLGDSADDRRRALDAAMLPVLLRFKGRPEVGPGGDIVYVFPELQESKAAGELILGDVSTKDLKKRLEAMGRPTTAVERAEIIMDYRRSVEDLRRRSGSSSSLAPGGYLPERELKFSEAEDGQIAACAGLGAFALLATLFLGANIASGKALILARVYPIIGLVVQSFPFLLGYTASFLGIPAFRWSRLGAANEEIAKRNAWRSRQAEILNQPDKSLRERLATAANWALGRKSFGEAIFDSSKSTDASARRSEADDLAAFDRKLGL